MNDVASAIRSAVVKKANERLYNVAQAIVSSFKLEMQVARYERAANKSRGYPDTEVRDDSEANIMITKKIGNNGVMEYSVSFKPGYLEDCSPGEFNELQFRFGIAKQRALGRVAFA